MSGGFLGLSLSPAVQLSPDRIERLQAIDSNLIGPDRRCWGAVRAGSDVLITWRRESGIGTSIHESGPTTVMCSGISASSAHNHREASGVFSRVELSPSGLTASCDIFGYGSLFHWSGSGAAVVSTRPELVARVAGILGERLTKSSAAVGDLGFVGWLGSTLTGWNEISAVPAAGSIRLASGHAELALDSSASMWAHEPPHRPLGEIVDDATDALTESLEHILESGFPIVADLTAGTDSRLVVAGLASLGGLADVGLQTIGTPGLADVDAGAQLARFLGASHRSGFIYPYSEEEFESRFRGHVANTCGMSNPMKGIREQPGRVDEIRVCGQVGEVVTGWPTRADRTTPARDSLDQIAHAFQAARVSLLNPAAESDAWSRLRGYTSAGPHGDLPAWFAAHRLYAEVRLRGRVSRVDDFTPEVRAYPLYNRRLVAAGVECLWHHAEFDLATLLIDRLAPGLNDVEIEPAVTAQEVSHKPRSFMQEAAASQREIRRDLFAAVARCDSEAWETIDHDAYVAAVDGYAGLKRPQVRLLHGAAAAVLWATDPSAVVPSSN